MEARWSEFSEKEKPPRIRNKPPASAMSESPREQWPMPEYLEAWKIFRANSDENEVTAQHLISQPSWPRKSGIEICDVGCGDGRLLAEVLKRTHGAARIRLVDPDEELLFEAAESLREGFPNLTIDTLHESVRECWPRCARRADVVLGIHLVYLLEDKELTSFITTRPFRAITFVVLDAPTSVFSQLWAVTADRYWHRAKVAHALLERAMAATPEGKRTEIRSRIPKRLFTDHKLADWLLSILCYRRMFGSDVPQELRTIVARTLDKHTDATGEFIQCESLCYELPVTEKPSNPRV